MKILAIETSCDETAAAVVEDGHTVLSSVIYSQAMIHAKTGGVVPEVAARAHLVKILPVIEQALADASTSPENIDIIAVSTSPGLVGSLLVGTITASTLAMVWNKPLVPVHHIAGHIYAHFLGNSKINFPAVVLTASGGHCELVIIHSHTDIQVMGKTLDDSAGEAFDKVAKMLGLGYPGGPAISHMAEKYRLSNNIYDFTLPRVLLNKRGRNYDFSFSGLKTATRRLLEINQNIPTDAVATEFEQAVCDTLATKAIWLANDNNIKDIYISGGVSANTHLRKTLETMCKENNKIFHAPDIRYTTDNAAMIGARAYYSYKYDPDILQKNTTACPRADIF